MIRKLKSLLVMSALFGFTTAAYSADLTYLGEVTDATEAFAGLTPPGTLVGGPIVVDDAAFAAGSIGVADIISINVNVGNFCFATVGEDCGGNGALVPIETIDSAAITGNMGNLGGSFSVSAFSPTFNVLVPIDFDLDGGTFSADGGVLGTVSGTGTLTEATDADGDGTFDGLDNCSVVANPGQEDANDDGFGNACDGDFNDDCIINFIDIAQFSQEFLGTNAVFDLNSDGIVNFIDFAQLSTVFLMPPGPSDLATCN